MPSTAASHPVGMVEPWLHVVAAVIRGADNHILLAQRPANKHQGGKWEFPGGKVEPAETPIQALQRELREELGINVLQAGPLIKVRYVYPERAVLLDVWEVTAFSGEPHGREGQPVAWFVSEQLPKLEFPPANYPIVTAARLPALCLITPEPEEPTLFLRELEATLQTGIRLVQFRARLLDADAYAGLAREVIGLVHSLGGKVILNSPPLMLEDADGLHLTSQQLRQPEKIMPRRVGQWLSAACHNPQELQQAASLGVDFAFLSPVLPTLSHPGAATLGWDTFRECVGQVNFPVYALGGLTAQQATTARVNGGQGVAAIRSLWLRR